LNQCGLSGAKITDQGDQVAGFEQGTQPHTHSSGLFGASADDLQGVGIEDGHERIIQRIIKNR
jgi:hypothetical protein